MKVIVYVPVDDARALEAEGHDAALWVREVVKRALSERGEVPPREALQAAIDNDRPGLSRSESDRDFKPDPKPTKAEKKGRR